VFLFVFKCKSPVTNEFLIQHRSTSVRKFLKYDSGHIATDFMNVVLQLLK